MVLKYRTPKKNKVITLFSRRATSKKSTLGAIDDDITVSTAGSGYIVAPTVSFTAPPAGGTAPVATAVLTGDGVSSIVVSNTGSGYITAPTISFNTSVVPPTGYCEMIADNVDTISVLDGGLGYTAAPTVNITPTNGNGSGAVATCTLGFPISSVVSLVAGGTGYTSTSTVIFTGTCIVSAAATATVAGGVITAITITNVGYGYTVAPTISATDGTGLNATVALSSTGSVVSVSVSSKGTGYSTPPDISFVGACSRFASASANLKDAVKRVVITNGGVYSTAPTLTITGGGFTTQATGTVNLSGTTVSSITLTAQGDGYSDTPTLVWSGGTITAPTTAVATCTLPPARTYSYTFEIPPMELSRNAKMGLTSLSSTVPLTDTNTYIVRCEELSSHDTWDNMLGYGILFAQQSFNTKYEDGMYYPIGEKELRQITLAVSEDLTSRDTGILSSIDFVITLNIVDEDEEEVQSKFMSSYTEHDKPPKTTGLFKY